MKNLKIKRFIKHIMLVFFVSTFFYSCDEYLDVDTDKDNPTSAPLNQLLPTIEIAVSSMGDHRLYSGDILGVYTHQFLSRSEQDQYGGTAGNVLMNNEWDNLYLTLTDIQTLINQAEESGDATYKGIGQALKAYMISSAVDLWGDIPFSEATLLKEGIVSPKFDNQEEIYTAVFSLLDEAKVNLNSGAGVLFPGTEDIYYGGDLDKWTRFVNTFKLKLYNQIRLSAIFNTSEFNALVAENNFFSSNADDFEFKHTASIAPRDERNQLFIDAYGGAQVDKYISPWFYEIMLGVNPTISTGNKDPRIPYYWANQLTPGQFPRDNGNLDTGDPRADYWDANTGFFSNRFGSIGPNRDGSVETDATFPGIFPCGGRYDDGLGFSRTIASGTGVVPRRMLTYDEFLYIQAELMNVSLMAGDAGTKLKEAVTASFAKVDQVVSNSETTQTVPVLTGTTDVTDFIQNLETEYAAATEAKKLEIIMTQKWVATFGDHMDQYTDYRRTGYPILADPLSGTKEYQLDNADGFPLNDAETVQNNKFQLSLFWPQSEINLNANAPDQKDPTAYKIFWDN